MLMMMMRSTHALDCILPAILEHVDDGPPHGCRLAPQETGSIAHSRKAVWLRVPLTLCGKRGRREGDTRYLVGQRGAFVG